MRRKRPNTCWYCGRALIKKDKGPGYRRHLVADAAGVERVVHRNCVVEARAWVDNMKRASKLTP